ncbi:hypothetical protein [Hyalangium minutum]|uniref:Uncharacterized protein n=1 Tax=Hyalangium minutum TaxID=394096 RepID=A0A085VXH0_9BACT|nr:hypothetical protein [Hyalangium minutum]KFE60133.1 hypothetical protein DB31_6004 [Hyalangium minutum]
MVRAAEQLTSLVPTVLQAYTQGKSVNSRSAQALLLRRFEEEAQRLASARFSPQEIMRIRRSVGPRERGLRASRAGDNTAAEQSMQEARAELGLEELSPEARLLVTTLHEAGEAYLLYRTARFEEAHAALLKSLEATNTLQVAHGHTFTEPRRIHLVRNLIHMEARRGRLDEALELGLPLLSYIEGDANAWPLSALRATAAVPLQADVAAMMFEDVLESLAEVLAPEGAETRRRLERFGPHLQSGASACAPFARPHQWLRLRWLAAEERDEEFLAEVPVFLSAGRGATPSLWHALVLELYRLSARRGAALRPLQEELTRDAPTFQHVPPVLRVG